MPFTFIIILGVSLGLVILAYAINGELSIVVLIVSAIVILFTGIVPLFQIVTELTDIPIYKTELGYYAKYKDTEIYEKDYHTVSTTKLEDMAIRHTRHRSGFGIPDDNYSIIQIKDFKNK